MVTTVPADQYQQRHPQGLWYLSIAYAVFFFSYISVVSLLVLYLMEVFKFSSVKAYDLFGSFNALIWCCPLLGGYVAEKLGYKCIMTLGFVLLMAGLLIVSIPLTLFLYAGLAVFILGYGFATPACFAMLGLMYAKNDTRRDSAYTLLYIIFNIGGLLSITSAGYFVRYFGYQQTMMVEGSVIIVALLLFALLNRWIKPFGDQSFAPQLNWPALQRYGLIAVIIITIVPLCALLLDFPDLNQLLLGLIFIAVCIAVIRLAQRQTEHAAKLKLYALLFLLFISLIFWALYFLEPSLLTVFIQNNVNRQIGPFNVPASSFYALDGFFIIILGYGMSRLWWYLAHRQKDLSIPAKFVIAMFCVGLGYLMLVVGLQFVDNQHLMNAWWVVLSYLLIAAAELMVGPISFAMVGRLSPSGKEGVLMGVQQLFMGTGAILSGYLAKLAATPEKGAPAVTNPIYSHAYLLMVVGTLSVAVMTMIVMRPMKTLIRSY